MLIMFVCQQGPELFSFSRSPSGSNGQPEMGNICSWVSLQQSWWCFLNGCLLQWGHKGGSWVVSVESVWFSQEKLKTLAQLAFIWYIFSPTYNLRIFQSILSPLVVSKAQYFPNWRLTISNLMGYDSIQSRAKQNLSIPISNWIEKRPGKVPFIKEWKCALCGGVAITCGFNCRKNRKKPWNNHCIGSAKKFILVFP